MFCEARAYSILVCVLIRLASDIGRDKVFRNGSDLTVGVPRSNLLHGFFPLRSVGRMLPSRMVVAPRVTREAEARRLLSEPIPGRKKRS